MSEAPVEDVDSEERASEDKQSRPLERVVVLMDYQNIHGWARRQFLAPGSGPQEGHIDPLKTAQLLIGRRARPSCLVEARVYRGRPVPDRQAGAARANDRQTAAWQRSTLVTVIRRNLQYPPNFPTERPQEKGIDVALAVDAVHIALTRPDVDAVIIFSSDNDLIPAVEMIRNAPSCHVEVAAWAKGNRLQLPNGASLWCHNINEAAFRTLEDKTDYAAVPSSPIPKGLIPVHLRK